MTEGEGQKVNGTVINADSNVEALKSGYYHQNVGADGTTIVFYGFRTTEEDLQDEYVYKYEGEDRKPLNKAGLVKYRPPSSSIKSDVVASFKEISGVADVRFFNIDEITPEEMEYLWVQNVLVPEKPDMLISATIYPSDTREGGSAHYPGTATPQNVRIGIKEEGVESDKAGIVFHEIGHAVGLKHTFGKGEKGHKHTLPKNIDFESVSQMSYENGDLFGRYTYNAGGYRAYDLLAMIDIYGPSKDPDPTLMKRINDELREVQEKLCVDNEVKNYYTQLVDITENMLKAGQKLDGKLLQDISKKLATEISPTSICYIEDNYIKGTKDISLHKMFDFTYAEKPDQKFVKTLEQEAQKLIAKEKEVELQAKISDINKKAAAQFMPDVLLKFSQLDRDDKFTKKEMSELQEYAKNLGSAIFTSEEVQIIKDNDLSFANVKVVDRGKSKTNPEQDTLQLFGEVSYTELKGFGWQKGLFYNLDNLVSDMSDIVQKRKTFSLIDKGYFVPAETPSVVEDKRSKDTTK